MVAELDPLGIPVDARTVRHESELRDLLRDPNWLALLADEESVTLPFTRVMELVHEAVRAVPCIVASRDACGRAAVRRLQEGATDVVWKDRPERLAPVLHREAAARGGGAANVGGPAGAESDAMPYQHLIGDMEHAVLVTDLEDHVLHANVRLEQLCGYAASEMVGRPAFELLLAEPDWYPLLQRNEARAQGASEQYEVTLQRKDGGTRQVRVAASPLRDRQGQPVGTIGILTDVGLEQRLRRRAALLERAVQNTGDAVLVLAVEDAQAPVLRVEYANPAFTAMTGYDADEVEGRTPAFLFGPDTDDEALHGMYEAVRGWRPFRGELVHYRKGGDAVWVESNLSPVAGDEEAYTHWVAVLREVTERIRTQREVETLNARLRSAVDAYRRLAAFSTDIENVHDVQRLIEMGVGRLASHLGMELAAFYDVDEAIDMVHRVGPIPARVERAARRSQRDFGGLVGHVARTGEPTYVRDYGRSPHAIPEIEAAGLRSQLTLPVFDGPRVRHVLTLSSMQEVALDDEELSVAQAFVRRLENALERARHVEEVVATREATFRSLGKALEYRDYETQGHADRVAGLAWHFGEKLGFDEDRLRAVQWGAYLHDLGKIAIPDAVLLKPGPLTEEEFAEVKAHAEYGDAMLRDVAFLPRASRHLVRHHHERWDGSGYPDGLAGEAIPLEARLFALVDVWDALTHERPYKAAWPVEKAIAEIERTAETHFDPQLVPTFVRLLRATGSAPPSLRPRPR